MTQTPESEFLPSHDCDSLTRMSLASLLYHALVDHPAFNSSPDIPDHPHHQLWPVKLDKVSAVCGGPQRDLARPPNSR